MDQESAFASLPANAEQLSAALRIHYRRLRPLALQRPWNAPPPHATGVYEATFQDLGSEDGPSITVLGKHSKWKWTIEISADGQAMRVVDPYAGEWSVSSRQGFVNYSAGSNREDLSRALGWLAEADAVVTLIPDQPLPPVLSTDVGLLQAALADLLLDATTLTAGTKFQDVHAPGLYRGGEEGELWLVDDAGLRLMLSWDDPERFPLAVYDGSLVDILVTQGSRGELLFSTGSDCGVSLRQWHQTFDALLRYSHIGTRTELSGLAEHFRDFLRLAGTWMNNQPPGAFIRKHRQNTDVRLEAPADFPQLRLRTDGEGWLHWHYDHEDDAFTVSANTSPDHKKLRVSSTAGPFVTGDQLARLARAINLLA
jgi:hypothetical protein